MILLIYAADAATDQPAVEDAVHANTMPSTEEEKHVQEERYKDAQAVQQEDVVGKSVEPIEVKAEENTVKEPDQEKPSKKHKKLKKFQRKKSKLHFHKKKRKVLNKKSRCLNCETLKRFID